MNDNDRIICLDFGCCIHSSERASYILNKKKRERERKKVIIDNRFRSKRINLAMQHWPV